MLSLLAIGDGTRVPGARPDRDRLAPLSAAARVITTRDGSQDSPIAHSTAHRNRPEAAPSPWTSQASPAPVPISTSRPTQGTAAACAASSLPTSTSQASWKPALAARSYAARTLPGSSSPSVTRGKNAEHRGAGSMFLPMARPIRRSSQLSGRVALVRARLGHLQAQPSRLDSGSAASMRCGQVARGNPVTRGCGGAQGNRADLQAQLWHDPGETRRILVVDGLQPLESCGRRLLTPCGEARTSWRGPRARTISWPCFRAARPSLRGVSGLLSSALYVRRFRAAVVTGASAAARFLWAVL